MSIFLSHLHADLRRSRITRRGATHKPEDVPKGVHKEYPRMQRIFLPKPARHDTTLHDALERRRSSHSGNPDIPVGRAELGTLFGLSLGKRAESGTRNYPSGGALYPVETYIISVAMESHSPAVFHYNPNDHALEMLCELPVSFDMKTLARHPEHLPLSNLIVFTSVWQRSSAKYGDLAYLHSLIEAGHMSENILLVGNALNLETRPYAGFNDAEVIRLLDIDEEEEQPIHTITLCKEDDVIMDQRTNARL